MNLEIELEDFAALEGRGAEPDLSLADAGVPTDAGVPLALAHTKLPSGYAAEFGELLRPEYRALPLIGRHPELQRLLAWLRHDACPVLTIYGRGGSGKTRLAAELCACAEAEGWDAGFAAAAAHSECVHGRRNALLVVDAADGALATRAAASAGPDQRVLILARDNHRGTGIGVSEPIVLDGLHSIEDRSTLLNAAVAASPLRGRGPFHHVASSYLIDSADPLHLTMAGLLAPAIGLEAAVALPITALAARIAQIESERLDRIAGRAALDPFILRHLATCITLQGGCELTQAAGIAAAEAAALGFHLPHGPEYAVDALADALISFFGDYLQPIGPEQVRDAFVSNELDRHAPEVRSEIIARAAARNPAGATSVDLY